MHNPQGKRSVDITRPRFFKREVDTQMTGHNWEKRDTVTEKPKREVETQTMAHNRGTRDVTIEKPEVKREDEALKTAHSMNKRDIMEDSHRPQREVDTQTTPHNLGKKDTVMARPKRHAGTQNQFSGQKTASPIQG
ncbi:hypothetical protein WR25_03183 [Diploscapter pachys]|uniref:Uncharacterized protein n=1 Tax=Diploscapter pachys TaxID=2018661 RepID=A0A2A2L7Z4_9BILA|nr:hypothetical protein WR25_03183 [Diploscapter pachys]